MGFIVDIGSIMATFRIVGLLLFVGLLAWIVAETTFSFGHHPSPEVLGLGNAFEGNLQLPSERIRAAFDTARSAMLGVNVTGSRLRTAGDVAGWLSFVATALITLLVGFLGRPVPTAGSAPNTEGLPLSTARTIGTLAASAAILTAFANLAIAKSQDYFKHADEIRDLIVHARAQVIGASSADDAQAVLDDLELKSAR
jgi:hypothetical protein